MLTALLVLAALSGATLLSLFALAGVRWVPNGKVGIVERRFCRRGSVESGLIALHGEAGYQPAVLRGGLHWLTPLQHRVHRMPLVTIPQGQIGYVFARDGAPLAAHQTLASNARAAQFEDAARFLREGGQRGPQRRLLREGTYAINLAQFVVITERAVYALPLQKDDRPLFVEMAAVIRARRGFTPIVIEGAEDEVGVVTVHDGPPLAEGQILAPSVGGRQDGMGSSHQGYQDPEAFLLAGGRRGRQLDVLVEGTYYVNRLFATVELEPKTVVEVGNVGVVVWYAGDRGADLSGAEYRHGELVRRGERGVWSEPLLPGKYAFNTYAGKVVLVPTTNFILKWIRSETGAHRFDENLSEVSLITKDAFEPSLPLSVVVHIDYQKAPLVIQRFGDIRRLVEQTLDPMVAAYFKNVGQTRTLIQLLQDRSEIQRVASAEMRAKFVHYNLELEEVLIGTPAARTRGGETPPRTPPAAGVDGDGRIEQILEQLRLRQVAEERIETYARQEKAAVQERVLREAEARARKQQELTDSEVAISISGNHGRAEYERSLQEAARIRALAEAEAERAARIGIGRAVAIEEQVKAYGGPQYQLAQEVMTRFTDAIREAKIDIVPRVVVGGGGGMGGAAPGATGAGAGGGPGGACYGGGAVEALLAMLLSDRFAAAGAPSGAAKAGASPSRAEVAALREKIAAGSKMPPFRAEKV